VRIFNDDEAGSEELDAEHDATTRGSGRGPVKGDDRRERSVHG
ncbi:MAG: hypothetical protein QOI44_1317, partial [Actinomycetota bacterium]|nr:hypothetical protein [Actinomycetota bacterium]